MVFIYFSKCVYAQQTISGHVTDENNKPLTYASITATKDGSGSVIAYAICDVTGNYSLSVTTELEKLHLSASHVGYLKKEIIIPNKTARYDFVLQESAKPLKDIIVKSAAIYEDKDTLNYAVNAFTSAQDRVIGDVIKKLPGIEIRSDGIYYQGRRIQRYLINGLNLLGSQYNLANDNLPADAVKKVQVIQHDQPISILDSLITGQSPSLNLQLKKFTTTGRAGIGTGISPVLWDVNITPMTFRKNFQTINSLQSNNTGRDLSQYVPALLQQGDGESPLTGIQSLANPPFDKQKWLNNHANLITSNTLQQLNDDWQIRMNLSYLNNYEIQSGNTQTYMALPNKKINITEIQKNSYNTNFIKGNITLEKNSKKNYIRNDLLATKKWDHNIGNLLNNGTSIYQSASNNVLSVFNNLQVIKKVGKQLVNFNSKINYDISPQQLAVMPGQFDSLLNNNEPYNKIIQDIQIKSLKTDDYINITKQLGNFTISPIAGLLTRYENINSYMTAINENEVQRLDSNYQNNIAFFKTDIYTQLNIQYKKNGWLLNVETPVNIQHFYYKNMILANSNPVNSITFQPKLDATYQLNPLLDLSFNSNVKNNFGSISQLYTAYILQTYRNLQRSSQILPESSIFDNALVLNYKNPIRSFFAAISYNIFHIKNNLQINSTINPDGSIALSTDLQTNNQETQLINLSTSKYFHEIKTSLKASAQVDFNKATQIINGSDSKIKNDHSNINWEVNYSPKGFLNVEYTGQLNFLKNKVSGQNTRLIKLQEHHGEILFFPYKSQMLKVQGDYYVTNLTTQNNQFFLNMIYRFSIIKKNIDLELHCNNLLNTKYFTTIYTDAFSTIENTFQLRPRQFLVSINFNFK